MKYFFLLANRIAASLRSRTVSLPNEARAGVPLSNRQVAAGGPQFQCGPSCLAGASDASVTAWYLGVGRESVGLGCEDEKQRVFEE